MKKIKEFIKEHKKELIIAGAIIIGAKMISKNIKFYHVINIVEPERVRQVIRTGPHAEPFLK